VAVGSARNADSNTTTSICERNASVLQPSEHVVANGCCFGSHINASTLRE
jgi:hypothetical protein